MTDQNKESEHNDSTHGRPIEPLNKNISDSRDLKDSPHDEERMQPEEFILDLPDVSDIPGQEHIIPPRFEAFADTTISSDDEEGVGIFGDEEDEDDDDLVMTDDSNVIAGERADLETTGTDLSSDDSTNLRQSAVDNTDLDGDKLNEASDVAGGDLDTSGIDDDDAMEDIGEEDEENNTYSLGDEKN